MQLLQTPEAAAGQQQTENRQHQRRRAQQICGGVHGSPVSQVGENAVAAHHQQDARQQKPHQHRGIFAVVYLFHKCPPCLFSVVLYHGFPQKTSLRSTTGGLLLCGKRTLTWLV